MYKKIFFSLLLILFGSLATTFAQSDKFEGKIVFNITTSKTPEPQKMSYYLKDNSVRMEVSQMPGYMLVKDSLLTVVMPVQKIYMQMSLKENKNVSSSPDDFLKDTKPKPTGRTKEILGYKCEEYVVQDSNGTVTVWGTEEFTKFPGFDGSGEDALAKALDKENFFPMLIDGNQQGVKIRMEVIEIKEEKLNDNLFKIPERYNKVEIPGM